MCCTPEWRKLNGEKMLAGYANPGTNFVKIRGICNGTAMPAALLRLPACVAKLVYAAERQPGDLPQRFITPIQAFLQS